MTLAPLAGEGVHPLGLGLTRSIVREVNVHSLLYTAVYYMY